MKKREKFMIRSYFDGRGRRGGTRRRIHLHRHGRDLGAGTHALQAVDDDVLASGSRPVRTTRRPSTSGPSVTARY